jgi:hypothetical protein
MPSEAHDAVHVATLNLQHLVLREVKRRARDDVTTDLSGLLQISPRTAQRIVAGDHLLSVHQLVELACLFGDDVLAAIPQTVAELFPDAYRPFLSGWQSGGREFPRFRPLQIPETISWPSLTAKLGDWLAAEAEDGRADLLNEWVVAHQLVTLLAAYDIPGSLVAVDRLTPSPARWTSLVVLTRVPTRVCIGYLLDPLDNPVSVLTDLLRSCYDLLDDEGQGVMLWCLGRRMEGQFRVHLPELSHAVPGDEVVVPFQVAGQLGVTPPAGEVAPDLTIALRAATAWERDVRVMVVKVGKAV